MNWLDKTINFVAPTVGLKRARARAIANTLLSYEGVRGPRRQGGWNTTTSSGNAEIGPAHSKLSANARDLCRNNAYGRRAKREWAKRVVGTGISPRADVGNDGLNKKIMGYWNLFARECCSDHRLNFAAAEKLIVSSCYESGEVLVRLWDRYPEDGLAVPFQIQILEADFIDSYRTMVLDTGYIIQGVQFDLLGRVEGYWLFGFHPGEVLPSNWRATILSKFVPVDYVLHHLEIDRPGDVRAVTRFASVMAKLRDIDEYADATIMRKKIEACLAAMVTQAEGIEGPTLAAAAVDSDGKKIEDFRPGMIMYGAPGADVKFLDPSASGDYSAYKKTELREVATGLEIPYVVLDDNLEAVNYSSYRGGLLSFRDAIEEYRWNWLIPQVLDPIWRKFVDKLFTMGEIPEPNYQVKWDPPPFDLLDRGIEAEADRMELQIGKKTYPQLVSELGNDPDTQIQEIADWKDRLDAAGVSFAKTTRQNDPAAAIPNEAGGQGGNNANTNP
jgi:lambda family phage portal protein